MSPYNPTISYAGRVKKAIGNSPERGDGKVLMAMIAVAWVALPK
jgi:hypothetical protein